MRVGYLINTYPRASDTFIQREVAGVRSCGVGVVTYSVREPGREHLVGPEQVAEHSRTRYVLPASIGMVTRTQLRLFRRSPSRWAKAAQLAWRTRSPGLRALVFQAIYFAEAGIVAEWARSDQVEHLHNHFGDQSGSVALLAAAMTDLPFSMTIHGPHIFFAPERWALAEKVERAAFVICISHFARSQVMVFAPQTCWPRLRVVHCGVQPALFDSPTSDDGTGRYRVLAIGRLAPEKGIPTLLRAAAGRAAELPGLEIVVIGDGPERAAIERLAQVLALPVRFAGNQSQAAVRDSLRESDVLVAAGLAEGLPTAILEAMAARIPVIATRVAGVAEAVEDGVAGRLVSPGDEADLAGALVELYRLGPAGRREWGEAGRSIVVESFDADVQAAKLADYFRVGVAPRTTPNEISSTA